MTNDCQYCGFRRSNRAEIRRTLSADEIRAEVEALLNKGHKRSILVFGEHPHYSPEFMADCVRLVYSVKAGRGFDPPGERECGAAGYGRLRRDEGRRHRHLPGLPGNLPSRNLRPACAKPRARENICGGWTPWAGRWKEAATTWGSAPSSACTTGVSRSWGWSATPGTCRKHYRVGPHTISFPRLRPASGVAQDEHYRVTDEQFKHLVAILRLAVPYTGLILTAREPAALRREVMAFGVSQIDAGSRIELGGYSEAGDAQAMNREQFELGDIRPLDDVIRELAADGYIPSFCTACYRLGRTGEHFMEFAIPGFIQNFCTPNALSTFMEYLVDYGSRETCQAGLRSSTRSWPKCPRESENRNYWTGCAASGRPNRGTCISEQGLERRRRLQFGWHAVTTRSVGSACLRRHRTCRPAASAA